MKKLLCMALILVFAFTANAQNQAPQATAGTSGKLTVNFSMNNAGGSYGTSEAIAVYITNNSNALVNTLFYRTNNGDGSASHMTTWWALIGSAWPSAATRAAKTLTMTDATTGATTSSYLTNQVAYWGNNAAAAAAVTAVADGTYKVNFETTNGTLRYYSGTFVKGPATSSSTVVATTGFTGITISWVPSTTAVENIEAEKLYAIYPNPAVSSIYVAGSGVNDVQIFTVSGKSVLRSNLQTINISKLQRGIYLVQITTNNGTLMKKLVKE